MSNYEMVIGIEVHARISTKSKMFCGCSNDFFGKAPNSTVCPICMGFPGVLPVLNKEALEKGIKAALALHCSIPEKSLFDRKNYFYPDLPKAYQISQWDNPVSIKGYLDVLVNGEKKRIGITRLHLEEDAGKLTHVAGGTWCDYNRSGTPLMEIVSEPDIRSADEAVAYAEELQKILRYVGSADCDMEKGGMRFDLNISLREKGTEKFGTKVEVKNLNSFRSLEKAIHFEFERQENLISKNEKIIQETRGFDDVKSITVSQRTKEEANDYRYFPEPDLPPIYTEKDYVENLKKQLPELPTDRKERFMKDYSMSEVDARILTDNSDLADFYEKVTKLSKDAKRSCSYITTNMLALMKVQNIGDIKLIKISVQNLADLIKKISSGEINNNIGKQIFEIMFNEGKNVDQIIKEKGLIDNSSDDNLEKWVKEVISENPGPVAQYKSGKISVIAFFIGKIMAKSQGKANPGKVKEVLERMMN